MGLIGLGNMGTAIGERLLDAGYPLVVNNRHREKADALGALGAAVATTPEDLVAQVDVVLTSLADDKHSRRWREGSSPLLVRAPCSST